MNKSDKIYVAGHTGLAGSAILRRLEAVGFHNLVTRTHRELELMEQHAVARFFAEEKPQHVILAAARVGGILANETQAAEFIRENLLIQTHVIHEAYSHGAKSLLFLGSSCIYPRDCPQPIREQYFLTGPLEKTNIAYAAAKIAGVQMCHAYNRQYGTSYICVMPTNLYGSNDNFDLNTSHVLAAMVRKFHEAKVSGKPVVLWGTGRPRREFLHADDMADACVHIMGQPWERSSSIFPSDAPPIINVGCGEDLSIRELAGLIAEIAGYRGEIQWDSSKPDGTPRKLLDISRLKTLDWGPRIGLREGIQKVYEHFQQAATVNQ